MIICLAGFMGSGKTYLMQSLSKAPAKEWVFKDLDDVTLLSMQQNGGAKASMLGAAIHELGMEKFRQIENDALRSALSSHSANNLVLSLGGGTLERGLTDIKNSPDTFLVGVDTSFEVCWQRIRDDKNRPLAQASENEVRELFTRRRELLKQADLLLTDEALKTPPSLQELVGKLSGH